MWHRGGYERTEARACLCRSRQDYQIPGWVPRHADALLVAAGSVATSHGVPDTAGVTEPLAQDTLIAQFNEIGSISIHFDEYPDSIACVIVEPVAGNMGVVPPEDEFLQGLREITTGRGVSLLFDEIITGF
ncbi:MAG TPA: aminotransferase class III-fold pyridoxal phosphate-dependent enzyme, partial [Dehalococcoidia bacterium]|nr:aminotransferase class III-fold pyridoxal phosphate-dependent enzyme [Dehalococcoidia bacterium]